MSECKIPREVVEEYHVCPNYYDSDLIAVYQTFLIQTDYKIVKFYEQLMSDFDNASQIVAQFKEENADLLRYRQIAREELWPMLEELDLLVKQQREELDRQNAEYEAFLAAQSGSEAN